MSQIPMPPGGVPPLGPRLDVSVGDLSLTPGQTGIVAVLIRNLEFVARTYSLGLVGVDPEWVALPAAVGPLAPGASVAIEIPITLPNGFPACDYAAVLHFQPRDPVTGVAAGPAVAVNLALTIGDGSLISATLDPAEVRGRERGRFRVVLRNRSPSAMRIELSGVSAGDELRVRFAEPAIALMPGQEVQIKGAVHGHRPVFGQTRRRPFVVRVQGRSTPVLLDGSFTQRPVASSLVLKVAAVVLLIGAWALLAFFLLGRLSSSTNKKAVAKSATAPNPAAPADNGVTSGGGAGGAGGAAGGASGAGGVGGAGGAAGAPGSAKLTR
ncbi:MAG: hypothetical protein M3N98_07990, partial [Actinomycetota bacterium]|nr:hypothetical protein [Actinomycetota bacterium]